MDKDPITTSKHLRHLNSSFSLFSWVSKSFGFCLKNRCPLKEGGAVSWSCAVFKGMEELGSGRDDGSSELFSECRESSSSCEASSSGEEKQSCDGTEESSLSKEETAQAEDGKMDKSRSNFSDIELMKERFAKLLLGEDMSGCGKGVCSALAISNAITNLCATLFGQLLRLEPLLPEKKAMWQRDMEWLLCVSDHIVEMVPSWQTFPDGGKLEVMTCRPRTDLYINLPALRKLDHMLIEILDSFCDQEFWYADQGIEAADSDSSSSLGKPLQRQEEKWWLPVPRVPPGGLQESSRKLLQHKRKCTNQILKAAVAINSNALAEMDVPVSYLDSLPKNGRESLGDVLHRYITSDQFSVECLLDCLGFSSEHQALEIANRLEASIYMWRQKAATRPKGSTARSNPKSSLGAVRERVIDAEKRELLAERAESLLICLKQRFPGLTQTTLDTSKIQFNKDVGKSILESYSRALESLAFNIVARIDDVLYVDDLTKSSDQFSSISLAVPCSVPSSGTLDAVTRSSASFSRSSLIRPVPGERSPLFSRKKALTDSSTGEQKASNNSNIMEVSAPVLVKSHEDMAP